MKVPSTKTIVTTAVICLAVLYVTQRVEALRKIVYGA